MEPTEAVLTKQIGAASASPTFEPTQEKPWWKWLSFFLGTVVSGACLFFALRQVDLAQVWQVLQAASYLPLCLALGLCTFNNVVRAVRWGFLFESPRPTKLRFLFNSMMIGYLANNVLPARAGEVVRLYVFERRTGTSKSTSAATVILERLIDVLLLLMLVGVLSFFVPLPELLVNGVRIITLVFLMIAIFLFYLAIKGEHLTKLMTRLVSAVSPGLGQVSQKILACFVNGLSVLRSGKQAFWVITLTVAIWAIDAAVVGLVIKSLGLSLPWIGALFVLTAASLSAIVPAAPGAVGTYEFFTVTALIPFAVNSTQAAGLALVLHAVIYLVATVSGLFSLSAESLSWRELLKGTRRSEGSPK